MKIIEGFMIREVTGNWVAIPLAERVVEFNGIISLSETGAMIWKMMEEETSEDQIVAAIMAQYNAEEAMVRADVREFIDTIQQKGLVI